MKMLWKILKKKFNKPGEAAILLSFGKGAVQIGETGDAAVMIALIGRAITKICEGLKLDKAEVDALLETLCADVRGGFDGEDEQEDDLETRCEDDGK